MAEITRQVGVSSDDATRILGGNYWDLTHAVVTAGGDSVYYQRGGGMRFTNITIPKDATIDQAYLTLKSKSDKSLDVVNSRISAEDVDDAVTFADDAAAFDTRWAARTSARVNWDSIEEWFTDTDYDSPEIKTVIQEIVNRGGWNSGQDIVIFWEDFDDRSTHTAACYREAYSYDGSVEFAPKLVITYALPTPVADGRIIGKAIIRKR